jgi:hypothetical protein
MKAALSLALTLCAVGVLALAVTAQPPAPVAPPAPAAATGFGNSFGYTFSPDPHVWSMHVNTQNQANELAKQYLKAETESDKREIRQKLTKVLDQMFDEHMTQQQKELENLEKQIADLRSLMKKRANAKSTIVDRRIDQLIQDADGLGWNASGNNHSFFATPMGTFRSDDAKARGGKKSEDSKKSDESK